MYKYQILYLDRITIVPWRYLVNDIDLCRSPKSQKKIHKTPYFGVQDHTRSLNSAPIESFLLVIGPISHRYWDTAISFGVTLFEFIAKLYGSWNSSLQAAEGEDLVILACTVFDWSTRVTDGQTDRIAMAKVAAFARKNTASNVIVNRPSDCFS